MAIGDIQNFEYTGAMQQVALLAGKRYLVELWGAAGGNVGGKGGYAAGEIEPTEDTIINLFIGGTTTNTTGGWNGGGNGRGSSYGRGGGGATDIRIGGTALTDRVLVAGGGGGNANGTGYLGGAGGGLIGITSPTSSGGTGGTQSAGGLVNGAFGIGGLGGNSSASGGGGGGYYGGGGGQAMFAGGGGGSSFYDLVENGVTLAGLQTGHGAAKITEIDTVPTVLTEPTTFNLTSMPQSINLKKGLYKFELFGAAGGTVGSQVGGYGGYVAGKFDFEEDTFLYLFVGGKGALKTGGWNGGGNATNTDGRGGGGGGTDIRIGGSELSNRILVAGGGGGCDTTTVNGDGQIGAGGGLSGADGSLYSSYKATGGTQSKGGSAYGSLGVGGDTSKVGGGAGGGGFFGGGGAPYVGCSGAGGSAFLGDAINAETLTGVNDGDGYIVITPLSAAVESYDAEVSISQAYAMEASGIKFGNAAATIGQLSEVDTDGVKVGMGEASESLEAALSCHGAKTGVLGDVMITQPAGISASGTKVTACMAELSHQAILSAEGMKSSMAAVVVTQGHAIKVMLVKCGLAAVVISAYVEMAAQGIQTIFTPTRFVKPHKITATWARPGSSSGWPIINWKGRSKWNG